MQLKVRDLTSTRFLRINSTHSRITQILHLHSTKSYYLPHKTMAEASKPKYDSLPGIDTAPDVYETPELAEDVSTIQASTAVSESSDNDSDSEAGADSSAVRHQRLQTDQARNR